MDTSSEIVIFVGLILVLLAAALQHMLPAPPACFVRLLLCASP